MRILIDLQGAQSGSRQRGIGRYSRALGKAITRNRGHHDVFILLNGSFPETIEPIREEFLATLPQDCLVIFSSLSPVGGLVAENAWRKEAAELIREWVIDEIAPDVVLVTSLFEGAIDDAVTSIGRLETSAKVAVVLYDLIPFLDPERYLPSSASIKWYYSKIDSLRRADLLLPISESARYEAVDLGFDPNRAVTIYSAADERFTRQNFGAGAAREFLGRFGIRRDFVMHASAFEPRKNFEGLIRAFALLPKAVRRDHQLLLVSAIPLAGQMCLRQIADQAGLDGDEMVFAGHVTDSELVALYSLCTLFVFPCFHEGFGLPALEAMRCGAVVIGSNTTSIPEVLGREDALFDPSSDQSIAILMERAITDQEFRGSLKLHAIRQGNVFSWDRSAELAIRAIEQLAGSGGSRTYRNADGSVLRDRIKGINVGFSPCSEDLEAVAQSIASNSKILDKVALRTEIGDDLSNLEMTNPKIIVAAEHFGHRAEEAVCPADGVEVIRRDVWLPDEQPRILLLKLDHIGDFVISLDAFRLIRDTWPKAKITLVCGSWNQVMAVKSGFFDNVRCCDFYPNTSTGYRKEAVVTEGVAKYRALDLGAYDLAVDLRYYDDNRLLLLHTNTRYRAGYVADGVPLDLELPMGPETINSHIGARTIALAAAVAWTFGAPAGRDRDALLKGQAPSRLFEYGVVVGIAPGTGNPIKSWGRDRFAELAKLLHRRGDYRFVFIGGDHDRSDTEFIGRGLPSSDIVDLAGTLAISDVPPVIAGLDLFIGNDTSTTHMAALMGVPTVCVFSGPVFLESWRPVGPRVITLKAKVDCSPCNLSNINQCSRNHQCMDISPSRVAAEVTALVGKVYHHDWIIAG